MIFSLFISQNKETPKNLSSLHGDSPVCIQSLEEDIEMAQVQLVADVRTERGKEAASRLRRQGILPAVLYGGKSGNIPLSVDLHDLHHIVAKGGGETTLINLAINQEKEIKTVPVIIKELQIDPVKRTLIHADFLEITMGHVIEIHVPFELTGESPGVKAGGILEFLTREITVECLPSKMAEHFNIDISALEVGDSVTVGDLSLGDDYKIITDHETVIVTIARPLLKEAEEEEEAEAELEEPEVIQKGKKPEEEE
jgi:large subunit ribosomal protein L25